MTERVREGKQDEREERGERVYLYKKDLLEALRVPILGKKRVKSIFCSVRFKKLSSSIHFMPRS